MIWIVTNHEKTRTSLATLLASRFYRTEELECGDEVVTRLRFRTPKLIIIDCGLPDSFDTLRTVRGAAESRAIPVVMFSIDDRNMNEKCLLAGADAYVPKGSLDWAELFEQIVRFAGPPEK